MTSTSQNSRPSAIDYYSLCRSYSCSDLPELLKQASILGKSDDFQKICPPHLEDRYFKGHKRLSAHFNSLKNAGISVSREEEISMIPAAVVNEYCDVIKSIAEYTIKSAEPPKNYNEMSAIYDLVQEIGRNKLKVEWQNVNAFHRRYDKFTKLRAQPRFILYDMWRSVTGRLTTKQSSFPILSLDKVYRPSIVPENDFLIELDYNAAEIRTLLFLMGIDQPEKDIHEFLMENVFPTGTTRDEAKRRVFSWLYDGNKSDPELEKIFNRDDILKEYFDGKSLHTPTNRHIYCDKYHALNYLLQGTTSDMLLLRASEISKILKGQKSKIYFTMHDSLVLDFSNQDAHLISKIYKEFRETPFGNYKVNASIGKNYGALKKL